MATGIRLLLKVVAVLHIQLGAWLKTAQLVVPPSPPTYLPGALIQRAGQEGS